jgi:hypothetical protein
MPQIKLKVVRDAVLPPPWTAPARAGPLFTGSGDTGYVAGSSLQRASVRHSASPRSRQNALAAVQSMK